MTVGDQAMPCSKLLHIMWWNGFQAERCPGRLHFISSVWLQFRAKDDCSLGIERKPPGASLGRNETKGASKCCQGNQAQEHSGHTDQGKGIILLPACLGPVKLWTWNPEIAQPQTNLSSDNSVYIKYQGLLDWAQSPAADSPTQLPAHLPACLFFPIISDLLSVQDPVQHFQPHGWINSAAPLCNLTSIGCSGPTLV